MDYVTDANRYYISDTLHLEPNRIPIFKCPIFKKKKEKESPATGNNWPLQSSPSADRWIILVTRSNVGKTSLSRLGAALFPHEKRHTVRTAVAVKWHWGIADA